MPVLLVSTGIRSISTSSILVIIRSISIIISSVFGHLFSRPSLAAQNYGLVGCDGCHKHKGLKLIGINLKLATVRHVFASVVLVSTSSPLCFYHSCV